MARSEAGLEILLLMLEMLAELARTRNSSERVTIMSFGGGLENDKAENGTNLQQPATCHERGGAVTGIDGEVLWSEEG